MRPPFSPQPSPKAPFERVLDAFKHQEFMVTGGYRRITQYLEGGVFGWEKVVSIRGTRTKVTLTTNRGRVNCVYLEQPR